MFSRDDTLHFDPATYARSQQSHHAAVLQKVLDHSLSILPSLVPSSHLSSSSTSSSSPRDTLYASPTHSQNAFGYPNLNPSTHLAQPNGIDAFNQVHKFDGQGLMQDFSANTFSRQSTQHPVLQPLNHIMLTIDLFLEYPYNTFGTYSQIPQDYNPVNAINPGCLHDTEQPRRLGISSSVRSHVSFANEVSNNAYPYSSLSTTIHPVIRSHHAPLHLLTHSTGPVTSQPPRRILPQKKVGREDGVGLENKVTRHYYQI
jgi:hypothetical protein